MGMGKAQHVAKLSDEMAIELGAEMLGEFTIFSIAAITLTLEYQRSAAKEVLKEQQERQQVLNLKQKLEVSYIADFLFLLFILLTKPVYIYTAFGNI